MTRRPHGADEVRRAVIIAARRRFAAEGPSVSLRAIAADANVNLGLLHRHFGSKASLLEAVLTDTLHRSLPDQPYDSIREVIDAIDHRTSTDEEATHEYVRIMAWMLLAGDKPRDYIKGGGDSFSAKIATPEQQARYLLVLAALFGWRIFGDHIAPLAQYGSSKEAEQDLFATLRSVVDRNESSGSR